VLALPSSLAPIDDNERNSWTFGANDGRGIPSLEFICLESHPDGLVVVNWGKEAGGGVDGDEMDAAQQRSVASTQARQSQ
jgi:hypothetical protein